MLNTDRQLGEDTSCWCLPSPLRGCVCWSHCSAGLRPQLNTAAAPPLNANTSSSLFRVIPW